MTPAILGLSVTQINLFINTLLGSFLPQGSVTYLYYGNRIMQLPLGVFGVAIATALLPVSSGHLVRGETDKFINALSFGLRLLFLITVPCAVGLIVLSTPINAMLFEYGRFHHEAVVAVAQASVVYTTGLIGYAGVKVVVPTFYALDEPRIPLYVAIATVAINIILNVVLMRPLGFLGLALATVIAAYFNFAILLYMLRRRMGRIDGKRILNSFMRVCLASAGMGLLVWFGSRGWLPDGGSGLHRGELVWKVFALIGLGAAGYAGFGWLFRLLEQKGLINLVRSKVGLAGTKEPWIE